MAKPGPKPKTYTRRSPDNFTEAEVIAILEDVIERYMASRNYYYPIMLISAKLYPSKLHYWKTHSPAIQELVEVLDQMRDAKIKERLIIGKGNVTGAIWYTKANMSWCDEATKMRLETDIDIANMDDNITIEIGFDDEDISQ